MFKRVSIFNVVYFGIVTVRHSCTALINCGASSLPQADKVQSMFLWACFAWFAATKPKQKVVVMNGSKAKRILMLFQRLEKI
jgi:hypothetical protein